MSEAKPLVQGATPTATFESLMFPHGTEFDETQRKELFEYYKLLAQHGEQQAQRRQQVNSFFVSINSFLIAGVGIFTKDAFAQSQHHHAVVGVAVCVCVLGTTGIIVCRNWSGLIRNYAHLVQANMRVATELEKHLLAAMYTATHAFHSHHVRSLTTIESRVAHAIGLIHLLIVVAAIYVMIAFRMGVFVPN